MSGSFSRFPVSLPERDCASARLICNPARPHSGSVVETDTYRGWSCSRPDSMPCHILCSETANRRGGFFHECENPRPASLVRICNNASQKLKRACLLEPVSPTLRATGFLFWTSSVCRRFPAGRPESKTPFAGPEGAQPLRSVLPKLVDPIVALTPDLNRGSREEPVKLAGGGS